jgi:chromosome partitioning protein
MKEKIITIAHQKGGVGKSTIAFNLAVILKANVIDLDVQETMTQVNELRKIQKLKGLNILKFSDHTDLQKYIENYKEKAPLIIDCGGFDSSFNNIAISLATIVIIPVSDERIELLGLKKFQLILENLSKIVNYKINSYVVFNKINPRTTIFRDLENFVKNTKTFEVLKSKIRKRVDISNSVPAGFSVVEYSPNSNASKEFLELAEEVNFILSN